MHSRRGVLERFVADLLGVTSIAILVVGLLLAAVLVARRIGSRWGPEASPPATSPSSKSRLLTPKLVQRPADPDLAVLRSYADLINQRSYGGTFPQDRLMFWWGEHSQPNVYAFTAGRGIFVSPSFFERNWNWNFEVVCHEMSHNSVGIEHEHDQIFERELKRLLDGRTVLRFWDVRSVSGAVY